VLTSKKSLRVATDALAEAERRARANGLTFETYDSDWGPGWPSVRLVGVRLLSEGKVVAWCESSYRDDAGRKRALSISAKRVYNRPA
jgi:hypothetical protein